MEAAGHRVTGLLRVTGLRVTGLRVTGLLLALCALLPHPAAAIVCPAERYPETSEGQDVCCDYCDAGQEIFKICTPWSKASQCRPCRGNRFNEKNAREGCKVCTFCNKAEGSIEKKPCTKSSDAICECPEGSTARNKLKTACRCDKGREIADNKCQPCKPGYFSSTENSFCRPWTNCSAMGRNVLVQGSAMTDVKCTNPSNGNLTVPTTSTTPTSSIHRRKVSSLPNVTTTTHIPVRNTTTSSKSMDWGTLSLILIGAILLIVSAGIILTMSMQINRRKRNQGFIRGERVRVPVQEESTSSDSSLPKTCPA